MSMLNGRPLPPQRCSQCPEGAFGRRVPQEVTGSWPGWGTDGSLTLYELACGHKFLLPT